MFLYSLSLSYTRKGAGDWETKIVFFFLFLCLEEKSFGFDACSRGYDPVTEKHNRTGPVAA